MSDLRKFVVTMTLEWEMPVVAKDASEAYLIARDNQQRDLMHCDPEVSIIPTEVTSRAHIPRDWVGCEAYGPRDVEISTADSMVDRWFCVEEPTRPPDVLPGQVALPGVK